jgi:glucosamine kinase
MATIEYWIGVDGGGTGTRVRLQRANGATLAQSAGGPSGLAHGIEQAWRVIESCIDAAFASAALARPGKTRIAIGLGLAGVNNPQWAREFIAHDQAGGQSGYGLLALDTDAVTTLLGAHGGQAGAVVALGTGSVGQVLQLDGSMREVGGWGFPVGDEASGAWLGLRAINCAQQAQDGRIDDCAFTRAVFNTCGGGTRDGFFAWLAQANQTRFAQLAPLVLEFAASEADAVAHRIMHEAAQEVAKMAHALDPHSELPLALCGGLAQAMQPWLPPALQARLSPAQDDAMGGALHLIRRAYLTKLTATAQSNRAAAADTRKAAHVA